MANIKGILERPQERREDAMHTCITHENLKYSLEDANYFRYLMVWGFHKSKKAMMKCMNRNRHTPDAEWTMANRGQSSGVDALPNAGPQIIGVRGMCLASVQR